MIVILSKIMARLSILKAIKTLKMTKGIKDRLMKKMATTEKTHTKDKVGIKATIQGIIIE